MADIKPQNMADKLLSENFAHTCPSAAALTDPIVDTPMVVTLDQLRPYDGDPRVKRNPAYEEIKASIRERGLDAAPAITRRPGEVHYIIRNGGNTRLAVLRDLWSETKDERFFRIPCLFRPWSERGEIIALTGHLAENELRSNLTFIERALGVERARELYEQEDGQPLTQAELTRRLNIDGYPIQRSHLIRMHDAVRYLLPAIPTVLYAGLGRHQVERLVVMRNMCERTWERYALERNVALDFASFFQDVLSQFDAQNEEFSHARVQDELIGEMSELFGVSYDMLLFEITEPEVRQNALRVGLAVPLTPPTFPEPAAAVLPIGPPQTPPSITDPVRQAAPTPAPTPINHQENAHQEQEQEQEAQQAIPETDFTETRLQNHIVSPAQTTERLQSIQTLIAEQLGETPPPDFASNVLQSIPVQAGGLYPISDIWYIEPGLDEPERLRTHITQFAREIAAEAGISDAIAVSDGGIGFACESLESAALNTPHAQAVMAFLQGLDARAKTANIQLAALLCGAINNPFPRLSDEALVKLFRLLRLARRLVDLETSITDDEG